MAQLRESLSGMGEQFLGEMGSYLPNLVAALAVLIFGWLIALLVAKVLVAALRRTSIDNRIAAWVRGEEGESPDVEPVIGRIIFQIEYIHHLSVYFDLYQGGILVYICHGIRIGIPAGVKGSFSPHIVSTQRAEVGPVLAMELFSRGLKYKGRLCNILGE